MSSTVYIKNRVIPLLAILNLRINLLCPRVTLLQKRLAVYPNRAQVEIQDGCLSPTLHIPTQVFK